MPSRENLEKISDSAIGLFTTAVSDGLPAYLKDNRDGMAPFATAMAELSKSLVQNRLVRNTGEGGLWAGLNENVAGVADDRLDEIANRSAKVVETGSVADVIARLSEAGHLDTLRSLSTTAGELAAAEIAVPNQDLLRSVIGYDQAVAEAEVVPYVPETQLYDSVTASLEFLDSGYRAGINFDIASAFPQVGEAYGKLAGTLRAADYLVPGDSTVRTAPYSAQTPRGTRDQLEAVHAAAVDLAGALKDEAAVHRVLDISNIDDGRFVRPVFEGMVKQFNDSLEKVTPINVKVLKASETDEVEQTSAGNDGGLSVPFAGMLLDALDAGEQAAARAQFDTMSEHHVMIPAEDMKAVETNLTAVRNNNLLGILNDIQNGDTQVPGLSSEGARDISEALDQMSTMVAMAEKRGGYRAVSMKVVDEFNAAYENSVLNGGYAGLSTLAGRGEVDRDSLLAGRGVSEYATLTEALSSGRGGAPADAVVGSIKRASPEMTLSHYKNLPDDERRRVRAFVVKPDSDLFEGYASLFVNDRKATRYQSNRLREHLVSRLSDESGRPNHKLRGMLIGLDHRAIVAPSLAEAQVVREVSNRLISEQQRLRENERARYLANADRTKVTFDGADIRRFLRALDLSDATSQPATLTKLGDTLVLEHPEAPTIRGSIDHLSSLDNARDGYRLYKINSETLRLAQDTGASKVQIHLEDDRAVRVEAAKDAVSKAPAAKAAKTKNQEVAL